MSYANNITRLVELASRDYLRSAGLSQPESASILGGFDDDDLPTPRVVLTCNNAEPDGNADNAVWSCTLEVKVISQCDDKTEDEHHELAGEVFSQFMIGRTETSDALSAAYSGFLCQDILPAGQSKSIEERRWVSVLTLRVICNGSDLS